MSKTTIFLALVAGLIFGHIINQAAYNNAASIVYAECQNARQSQTVTEARCAELQDQYKIEFLCEARNTSPANHCWTEENKELGN